MRRRDFLTTLAAGAGTTALGGNLEVSQHNAVKSDRLGQLLPRRMLGRTGEQVTMLGIGGFHVGWTTEKDAQEVIEAAIEGGVRFFDNAESYSNGGSEERYGKYLVPKYREDVFIMTKTRSDDARTAREHLEGSLRRMKTDYLDLWQIHNLQNPEDVDNRLDNGVLDVLMEAKASGKVRYIGFTGHSNPEALLRMLERTKDTDPFDTCQMPVNIVDPNYHSFTEQVVPELQRRNIALLAMKTLADGRFFALKTRGERVLWRTDDPVIPHRSSIRDALHFAWSLPISVLITGAENASLVREKVDLTKTFTELSEEQRLALVAKAADVADQGVEYFKKPVS